eukprot:GHVP01018459.1.p1 GENE.GHVP01018459.1~~GHVP01018459.1.p1  ORF type:complete len:215 (+),score=42.43 GHVP01018459.1:37-645(+)
MKHEGIGMGEECIQDIFVDSFVRPLIQKEAEISKKAQKSTTRNSEKESQAQAVKIFCFTKLQGQIKADTMVITRRDKKQLTILEIKKNDYNLDGAIFQSALYSILFQTNLEQEEDETFLVSLIAVSLPNFRARIATFKFTLSKDHSKLLNPRLEIGDVFNWKTEKNATLLASHFLSDPMEPLSPGSNEIKTYHGEISEDQLP